MDGEIWSKVFGWTCIALQGVSITCDGFVNCCQVVIKFGIYDIVIVFVDIVICWCSLMLLKCYVVVTLYS